MSLLNCVVHSGGDCVVHSGEIVMLTDPATDALYSQDEYITQHKPCPVLGCRSRVRVD